MKKISFLAVLLVVFGLLVSCKTQSKPVQSEIQAASSKISKTETGVPEPESSAIAQSSSISASETKISSEISSTNTSSIKPISSSKPASSSKFTPSSSKVSISSKLAPTFEELKENNSKRAQEIIKKVTNDKMTDIEKAKATYLWLYPNFKYRSTKVDLSNGYTEELTHELADYFFKYRKGSCEHYAAAQKVLLEELGFECYYIRGERYSSISKKWGDHTWLMANVEGDMYHVDGLYGGLFYDVKETTFMVPDDALKHTHRWNKDTYVPCTKPQILK